MLLASLILILLNPPGWMLAAVWSLLPAAVLASDEYRLPWNLNNAFTLVDRLSDRDRFEFADRLLEGMHSSEAARWDTRRGMLLDACLGPYSGVLEDPGLLKAAAGLGQKHGKLLDVIGVDILRAAADRDSQTKYENLSRTPSWMNRAMKHPYFMLRYLVALDTVQSEGWLPGDPWPDLNRKIPHRRAQMPKSRAMGSELAFSFDRFRDGLLLDVAVDSGFAGRHAMLYFPDRIDQTDSNEMRDRITGLAIILFTHHDIGPDVTDRLRAWSDSANSTKAGFALRVAGWWCRAGPNAHQPTDELADHLLSAAMRRLEDRSVLYSNPSGDFTVRQAAQFALVHLDRTGARSLPLVREWLLKDGEFPVHARYNQLDADPELIASWAEHLSDLAWSENVSIRRWVARALPVRSGTPSDARIDEVINRLLADRDADVRWDSERAAEMRRDAAGKP